MHFSGKRFQRILSSNSPEEKRGLEHWQMGCELSRSLKKRAQDEKKNNQGTVTYGTVTRISEKCRK